MTTGYATLTSSQPTSSLEGTASLASWGTLVCVSPWMRSQARRWRGMQSTWPQSSCGGTLESQPMCLGRLHFHVSSPVHVCVPNTVCLCALHIDCLSPRVSNVYSDNRCNQLHLHHMYKFLEVGGPSIDSTDPSHFEFQFWCSCIACFWSYNQR